MACSLPRSDSYGVFVGRQMRNLVCMPLTSEDDLVAWMVVTERAINDTLQVLDRT